MDGLTFHKILRLIKSRWLGATLNRVSVLGDQLYFSFFCKGAHFVLAFRSSPPPSLEPAQVAQGEASGALDALSGAKLTAVSGRPYDRLGYFDFEKRRPSGKLVTYRFVLEPMGNYANAFLLNEQGMILYSLSSRSIDPDRDIGVGKKYTEPRANKKYSLSCIDGAEGFEDLTGFYPATAALAKQYEEKLGFAGAAEFIRDSLETDDSFYLAAGGRIVPFAPIAGAEAVPFEKVSFQGGKNENADKGLSVRLNRFYTRQLQHYVRLESKIADELSAAVKWPSVQDEADLVKANLHIIKKRGVYELRKYTDTGAEEVEYIYGSDEPPHRYADKLYRRAGKLKRALPLLEERLAEAGQLAESAREQIYYVENAEAKDLKELSELIKKPQKQPKKRGESHGFIEYRQGGAVFYLGRNSAANHKLVFQFAGPGDIWLHARNIPSSHCVIRKEGVPSDEDIMFAARLVASHSKNKNEAWVPVDYTYKKHVKKPKNTPVGFVVYIHFNTLIAVPFSENELAGWIAKPEKN